MQCFTATLLSKYLLTNDEPDDFDFDDDDTYDVDGTENFEDDEDVRAF